jgi:hypothetical protein
MVIAILVTPFYVRFSLGPLAASGVATDMSL